eukprot:4725330-Alexandrium_andersonii.AAC.1
MPECHSLDIAGSWLGGKACDACVSGATHVRRHATWPVTWHARVQGPRKRNPAKPDRNEPAGAKASRQVNR